MKFFRFYVLLCVLKKVFDQQWEEDEPAARGFDEVDSCRVDQGFIAQISSTSVCKLIQKEKVSNTGHYEYEILISPKPWKRLPPLIGEQSYDIPRPNAKHSDDPEIFCFYKSSDQYEFGDIIAYANNVTDPDVCSTEETVVWPYLLFFHSLPKKRPSLLN